MAAGWIIKRNNKENGPFSAQQLKKLATSGKLKREDLIRKEPGGKFMQATAVKGLFPEEDLEEADAGDSADFANVDISRFRDLPMADDEDDEDAPRKRRPKGGTAKAGVKRKKAGTKTGKGKSGKKGKRADWEDDPVNDLFWGGTLVCFAVGVLFYMDPETWELPAFMETIHEHTGRFGVSVVLLLLSLIFFIPAFQKIGRLKERGKPIPWHLPALGWLLAGLLSSSEESSEE
jgi:hypothetical protein